MIALDGYLDAVKTIAFAAVLTSLFAVGHRVGANGVQDRWDAAEFERTTAEKRALILRVAENDRIAAVQLATETKIKKGYVDENAKIRADYAGDTGRLRITTTLCSGPSSATEAAARPSGGDDAITGTVALPQAVERDLRALMREADMIVAGCRAAQEFIAENGMAP